MSMEDKFIRMSNDEYHGDPSERWTERLSATSIKLIDKSLFHFRFQGEPAVESRAFVVGRAAHAALLEADKFVATYQRKPLDVDGQGPRTKHYKEWMFQQPTNLTWLEADVYDLALAIADSALENAAVREAFDGEHVCEGSLFFQLHGVDCKARPDLVSMREDGSVDVVDLKTTQDASVKGFYSSAIRLKYPMQEHVYRRGLEEAGFKVNDFIFLAVEKSAPHASAAYTLPREDVAHAGESVERALNAYKQAMVSDVWPSYCVGVSELPLPPWRKAKTNGTKDEWLSVPETMKRFGVCRATLYRWLDLGVQTKRIGGRRLFHAASLEDSLTTK